ncbi:MAG: AAA family ATPase [Candidatus Alcyoniella australis]|nr:AAA family ATPase [Candidatus Alcyoniella australis]
MSSPTSITRHSIESLLDELVSGRAITDEYGQDFQLNSPAARAVLDWYRTHPQNWSGNINSDIAKDLADSIDLQPPTLPPLPEAPSRTKGPIFRLLSVKAHRFAGIHRYGKPNEPPKDFEFEFDPNRQVLLIEGSNGSGKTSILSAICWALTGKVFRSQREPESVDDKRMLVSLENSVTSTSDDAIKCEVRPITPMPSAEVLQEKSQEPICLDTSVELTFGRQNGKKIVVRRAYKQNSAGRVQVVTSGIEDLGIDQMSLNIGTAMPGLIPYIHLGKSCDLGESVAELTGLSPLLDLTDHARRARVRFTGKLSNEADSRIADKDRAFSDQRSRLEKRTQDNPAISPGLEIPMPGDEETTMARLVALKSRFQELEMVAYHAAQDILTDSFDPANAESRRRLADEVGPAIGSLDVQHLASMRRLLDLSTLTEDDLSSAKSILDELVRDANRLVELSVRVEEAERLRLYAKLAAWMEDIPEERRRTDKCPVCGTALMDKIDSITGRDITDHLCRSLDGTEKFPETSPKRWEQAAINKLRSELPNLLVQEINRDLPGQPADLIRTGIVDELFQGPVFGGILASLRAPTEQFLTTSLSGLPRYNDPPRSVLHEPIATPFSELSDLIDRIRKAVAFAQWGMANTLAVSDVWNKTIGHFVLSDGPDAETSPGFLLGQLQKLNEMVKHAEPLKECIRDVDELRRTWEDRKSIVQLKERYRRAAIAVEELTGLRELVEGTIQSLLSTLDEQTRIWKKALFLPAIRGAPCLAKTSVSAKGALAVSVESEGSYALGEHVCNSSDLRATLLAFLLAFREHLLEKRGGLSLLLLDELQELFDPHNRRRVARTIATLVEKESQIVVTTNNNNFAWDIKSKAGRDCVDHRCIHPLNRVRSCLSLGLTLEDVKSKLRAFENPENKNKDKPAQKYLNCLRIFLENQLTDMFTSTYVRLPSRPSLSNSIDAIRSRIKSGIEPFNLQVFTILVGDQALTSGSEFLDLMNESHHGRNETITFNDVFTILTTCKRVHRNVDRAHEQCELWMLRDPPLAALNQPSGPTPVRVPSSRVPIVSDLAAFMGQELIPDETINGDEFSFEAFDHHAVYNINTHNFGFAGARGCKAIVDCADNARQADDSLVIALHRDSIYARRLARQDSRPEIVSLTSEAIDPRKRLPSLLLPTAEVRLLPVVGILFDDQPTSFQLRGEAVLEEYSPILERVDLVFRVSGDSASPLALDGQWLLGGKVVSPDQLADLKGRIVAISTSEGNYLKRIGNTLSGASHVRFFEPIGVHGESKLIVTEEDQDGFSMIPSLQSARLILGVIYEQAE